MNSLDTIDTPFGFEALYVRPKHRRLKEGDRFSIEMEVDRECWDAFIAADSTNSYAVLVSKLNPATMQEEAPKTQPAPPVRKERGEYGWIAERIYKAGIANVIPVRAALAIPAEATTEEAAQALRNSVAAYWEVTSSTYCYPEQWREWAEAHGIGAFIGPVLIERSEVAR